MSCSGNFGEVINIDGSTPKNDYLKYYRAAAYGRWDSLVIAYGTCEKF